MTTVVHADATGLERPNLNNYTQGLILLSEPFQFFVFGQALTIPNLGLGVQLPVVVRE